MKSYPGMLTLLINCLFIFVLISVKPTTEKEKFNSDNRLTKISKFAERLLMLQFKIESEKSPSEKFEKIGKCYSFH